MRLSEATYFPDANELTRHGFVSHMEDFIGKLIGDNSLSADVDDYLKGFGIDAKKALEILTRPETDDMPESAVVVRTERIKNGGTDEFGKPMKDEFQVIYKVPKRDPERGIKGIDEKLRNLCIKLFENHIVEGTILNEDGEGGDGATNASSSGQYTTPLFGMVRRKLYSPKGERKSKKKKGKKHPIGKLTMFITEEQMRQLERLIREEEGGGALTDSNLGSEGSYPWYDAPVNRGNKDDDFWGPATDTEDIFSSGEPEGHDGRHSQNESKSGIHIKEKNKGKFTATKKRTGKSTEELTHSKNPLTRKRAIFAQNAKKWNKK